MELPRPTTDRCQADPTAYGYCLLADAPSETQLRTAQQRRNAQAAAERERGGAYMIGELATQGAHAP